MPRPKSRAPPAAAPAGPIVAYKGFDAQFECRGYRFAVGRTEKRDGPVVACESGFHACEHPLDVFGYYPPATSRFAVVELAGDTARHGSDTKIASAEITVRAEIHLPEMIAAAIKYVADRVTWTKGPIATGEREGARETADGGAATASGRRGAATASGDWGAATASGQQGKVRGAEGCAMFLVERDNADGSILHVWAGIAGKDGIRPGTFYRLVDGKPVEVDEDDAG